MGGQHSQHMEEAFDAALSHLLRGESAGAWLSGNQPLAEELLPLLAMAAQLRRLAAEEPPPPFRVAEGKQRFLQQAGQMRLGRRACSWSGWLRVQAIPMRIASLFAPLLHRGAASVVILAVLLAVLFAASTTMASASSLPGDRLYAVKRAAESVHLALTFDHEGRMALEEALQQRRIEEARTVIERQRQTTVSFHGVVESVDGATLIASGLTVHILPTTKLVGPQPSAGHRVAVVAMSQAEGWLLAHRIETFEPAPAPEPTAPWLTPTATATPAPTVEEFPAMTVEPEAPTPSPTVPDDVPPAHPTRAGATATCTPTPAPEAWSTVTATLEPSPTPAGTPTPTATPTGTLTPTPIATATAPPVPSLTVTADTLTPTPTPNPTGTAGPAPSRTP
jgi:hypothetical protein